MNKLVSFIFVKLWLLLWVIGSPIMCLFFDDWTDDLTELWHAKNLQEVGDQ